MNKKWILRVLHYAFSPQRQPRTPSPFSASPKSLCRAGPHLLSMDSDFNMPYPRKRPSSLVCDYVLNTTGRIPLKPNSILSNLPSRHYSNAVMSSLSWVPHHWLRREDITVIVAQRHSGWPIGRMFGAGYYPFLCLVVYTSTSTATSRAALLI